MGLAMFVATVTVADLVVPTPVVAEESNRIEVPIEVIEETTATEAPVANVALATNTEEKVREYFSDLPIMAEVARCESRFRQYDANGNVLRGLVNSQDVGVMQINEHYHLSTAQKLGLNLHTLEGNMAYARYLYEREGTRPWNYSSACWGKTREVALK